MQKEGIKYRKKVDDVIYYYSEGVLASQASEKDFAIVMMDGIHIRHIKRRHQIIVKVARLVVARRYGRLTGGICGTTCIRAANLRKTWRKRYGIF